MTNEFKPDWDEKATLVEEIQRMAKQIAEMQDCEATVSPPQRQPLTDKEIDAWWKSENGMEDFNLCDRGDFFETVRLVEKAHGIGDKK